MTLKYAEVRFHHTSLAKNVRFLDRIVPFLAQKIPKHLQNESS